MPKGFSFGFWGWFVFANIVFVAVITLMINTPSLDGFPIILIGIWVPTAIVLVTMFASKGSWVAIGILTAVLINTITVGMSYGTVSSMLRGHVPRAILAPMPSIYMVSVLEAMNKMSPSHAPTPLMDLFK